MAYIDPRYIHKMNINTRERYELNVWCQVFNCSKREILYAVEKVGNNAGKVKSVLKEIGHA
jgi:hypothetical protein